MRLQRITRVDLFDLDPDKVDEDVFLGALSAAVNDVAAEFKVGKSGGATIIEDSVEVKS